MSLQIFFDFFICVNQERGMFAFIWFFSTVCFQMCPQITCLIRGIVALVALVWLFSTVRFQMRPQMACLRRGKVALVASVWLFSSVCFQMCPKIACLSRCKVTQVTFVWLFLIVCVCSHWIAYTDLAVRFKICIHYQLLKSLVTCESLKLNWGKTETTWINWLCMGWTKNTVIW